MINCNTQFGKLKTVIVGKELELPTRIIDITFKHFYKEALGLGLYNSQNVGYSINSEILRNRVIQLDNLAKTLSDLGIVVFRPNKVTQTKKVLTPYYSTEHSSPNNVRDITLVYNDTIVETPVCIRNRVFENLELHSVFKKMFDNGKGGKWIKAPNTHLCEEPYDFKDWKEHRDFSNIPDDIEMAIDAPNFLTVGKDVIVNVTTYSQYLGYQWIKSLFPKSKFHVIHCADNHIDGVIKNLKPGVFLVNPKYLYLIDQLPEKFKKWKFIVPEDKFEMLNVKGMTDIDVQLASSRGMDINVLSIDQQTVLVNKRANSVINALEKNNFTVIPIELDNCEIFGGGINCSTLDLERDDEYEVYA